MTFATKEDVNFWGCIILANLSANVWFAGIFTALAAWNLYLILKESNVCKTYLGNTQCRESCGVHGEGEQPSEPKQRRNRTKTSEVSCG